MGNRDHRIDTYIDKAEVFARPILTHIRELIHKAVPGVEETIKWGMPYFVYKDAILCSMASFKKHASFGFWKASLMKDKHKLFETAPEQGMGTFGKIERMENLASDEILLSYITEAAQLNESGVKLPIRARKFEPKRNKMPAEFERALSENPKAKAAFEGFSPSNQRDFIYWIAEAKTEATRERRLSTAIVWLNEGKIRNWKYQK
jgi:uncharacterized protein YdeI (YjbR/CyaY-like superfamily)